MASSQPASHAASYLPGQDDASHLSRGYGSPTRLDVGNDDYERQPNGQTERVGRFDENFDARTRGSSILDGDGLQRSASRASRASTLNQGATPSRGGTLKKKNPVKRSGSVKRTPSRKSSHAGSIRGVPTDGATHGYDQEDSVFYTPVPTKGSPTELLADRFQTWRKFLKDLIAYFREVAASYEHRAKSLLKVSNVIGNTNAPASLLSDGGLNDASRLLRDFHKQAIVEANNAKEVETDVVTQLCSLRADLAQKIKEIKSLSGDFKNNVEKEKENTRKCVAALEEALASVDADPSAIAGKGDPYVVRLGVDRQVERQIDEENYLHRAYLNLENSGRELESIVVGEVQKAYNALASILKHDADGMYSTVEKLRNGPIAMPRDYEWSRFVRNDPHFVNPDIPLRRLEDIEYPGKHHPATVEVRAGMLERKSKYLKSYTPGWFVLSATYIHEFKSADRIYTQPPVMSLYLPDQKLGSRSQPGSSSHKFVIKGRQTGSMHRGHTWVFRAETYETMLAWFDDIKSLKEKSGEERDAFVRRHASTRSASAGSHHSRASSDGGMDDDEADMIPYSANQSMMNQAVRDDAPQQPRPSPGGRFPSDLMVHRNLQAPLSPSSGSSEVGQDLAIASGGVQSDHVYDKSLQQTIEHQRVSPHSPPAQQQQVYTHTNVHQPAQALERNQVPHGTSQIQNSTLYDAQPPQALSSHVNLDSLERHSKDYGHWMAPVAGGAAAGALATEVHYRRQVEQQELAQQIELDKEAEWKRLQALQQDPQIQPPRTMALMDDAVPKHHADHTTLSQPAIKNHAARPSNITLPPTTSSSAPAPSARDTESGSMTFTTTATAAADSLLAGSEDKTSLPFGQTGQTVNGGPVPMSFIEHEQNMTHPGVNRKNTDISVSDLHIPGEYPQAKGGVMRTKVGK